MLTSLSSARSPQTQLEQTFSRYTKAASDSTHNPEQISHSLVLASNTRTHRPNLHSHCAPLFVANQNNSTHSTSRARYQLYQFPSHSRTSNASLIGDQNCQQLGKVVEVYLHTITEPNTSVTPPSSETLFFTKSPPTLHNYSPFSSSKSFFFFIFFVCLNVFLG